MNPVEKFNGLNGQKISRDELVRIAQEAEEAEQPEVVARLSAILDNYPDEYFEINVTSPAIEVLPASVLGCLDCITDPEDTQNLGLGKKVTPQDIYQLITDKMIQAIKEATGRGYKKKWKDGYVTDANGEPLEGYLIPHNFVSKKPYRGINMWLLSKFNGLQILPQKNPFYLTFKQIEKLGGKLQKGAKGKEVVFYSILYKIKNDQLDYATYDREQFIQYLLDNGVAKKEITSYLINSKIPILRYYNVFSGEDVEGIDFDLENWKKGYVALEKKGDNNERLEIAEMIVSNYPKPEPKLKEGNSNRAYYSPKSDLVRMPHLNSFDTSQDYYRTLFHEFIHSTGAEHRLNRDFSGGFGSKPYAKEELVAEFGAVFLSAQAGIIWHTNKNHAEYLKNWHNVLGIIEEDNKFIMRAASDAQRAADFILQPDEEGVPLFLKKLAKNENKPKANSPKTGKSKIEASEKVTKKPNEDKKKNLETETSDLLTPKNSLKWSKSKKTILAQVVEAEKELKAMNTAKELRDWAVANGMDNRSAFPRFKKALLEIGINYEKISRQAKAEKQAKIDKDAALEITLYSDYKLGTNKFAITDKDGSPLWYGVDFDKPTAQTDGELGAAKKAIWLAQKIADLKGEKGVRLNLYVDAEWLTYQSHSKQKGYQLKKLAQRYNVSLNTDWIPGKDNPADEYTTASGYKKWSDNSAADLIGLLESPGLKIPCHNLTKKEISKEAKESTERVLKMNIWDFSNIPDAAIKEIKSWDVISKSPYSHSYYNDICKDWNYTTPGSLRLSDHWNFTTRHDWGKIHCPTNKPVTNGNWVLARWDKDRYVIIKDFGTASKKEMTDRNVRYKDYHEWTLFASGISAQKEYQKLYLEALKIGVDIQNYNFDNQSGRNKYRNDVVSNFIKKKKPVVIIEKGIYSGSGRRTKRVGSEKHEGNLVNLTREFATITGNITGRDFEFKNKKQKQLLDDLLYHGSSVFYMFKKLNIKDAKKEFKKVGLKSPASPEVVIVPEPIPQPEPVPQPNPIVEETTRPRLRPKTFGQAGMGESTFYDVPGETGKFLQRVERKPVHSVVITIDGPQGAGKTTMLYRFMNDFASKNKCLFISAEEHPDSVLAIDKRNKYISPNNQNNIDIVDEVNTPRELYDWIEQYDIILIDSWQKLLRMVGPLRLDEDLRKKFNGKVFVVIFQQTTTGRAKGGSEVVFDGDIIIKMQREPEFINNYAFFDKNRYTLMPLEQIRYNIAGGYVYNPCENDLTETTPPTPENLLIEIEEL